MIIDPLRRKALHILTEVYEGATLEDRLDRALNELEDRRSRSFLAELVRGTLQWRGRYQYILEHFVKRLPTEPVELALFHLTMHQLLALDGVPAYAAIHQAGELCRLRVSESKVGFFNGVLQAIRRRFIPEEGQQGNSREQRLQIFIDTQNDLLDAPEKKLAAWWSFPDWMVNRWIERFGLEATAQILEFNNQPVASAFCVLPPGEPAAIAQVLIEAEMPVVQVPGTRSLILQGKPSREELTQTLEQHPELIVQDPAVQRATDWMMDRALGQLPEALKFGPVLDMCASPGGKTARLATRWPADTEIVALDNRDSRIALLLSTVRRLQLPGIQVLKGDGLQAPFEKGTFAAVLLDGPCSGTGVLRHHPEGRWRLDRRTPGRNGRILRKLAHAAMDLLAEGGILMYSTCSLEIQENERVLYKLLDERDDVIPLPDDEGNWFRQWLPGQGDQNLHEAPGDGFFAALLQKTAAPVKD